MFASMTFAIIVGLPMSAVAALVRGSTLLFFLIVWAVGGAIGGLVCYRSLVTQARQRRQRDGY
ncbi:MAG: hypothetical protein JWO88_3650 [Frankiales bacterium]|nr:hypothetical protein [Frankiales bacterium]